MFATCLVPFEERVLSPEQLRALAHPMRVQILRLLREDGPATATQVARWLNTNSGLTSYHLRKLAAQGFVEDEAGRGTARERWWRPAFQSHRTVRGFSVDDPELTAVLDTYLQYSLRSQLNRAFGWLAERDTWDEAWLQVATFSEHLLRLNPQRLRALTADLDKVIADYQHDEEGPGSERVMLVLQAFPRRQTQEPE
jgi:DNA-binding transcriptional ArsR family regulator